MSPGATDKAVAEATSLEAARAAAGAPAPAGGPGTGDPFTGELRRAGLLPLLVLHFLAAGPSYGNKLMDRAAAATGGLLAVNPNTMYPLLRSLEAKGFVHSQWEHPERRSRRFYEITESGERERARLVLEVAPRLDAIADGLAHLRHELDV